MSICERNIDLRVTLDCKESGRSIEPNTTQPLTMSSLTSYLPASEGFLPKWLLFVRSAAPCKQSTS